MCCAMQTAAVGSESILLVDDEVAMVRLTQRKLEKLGYRVIGVTDPIEALMMVQAKSDTFDLIITDMVMPEMNGVQLAQAVKRTRSDLPVILYTGYSTISKEEALSAGICHYVEKPIEFDQLASCIRLAISGT